MNTGAGDDSPRYPPTLGPGSAWDTSTFSGSSVAPTEPESQDLNQVGNSPMETDGEWCDGGGTGDQVFQNPLNINTKPNMDPNSFENKCPGENENPNETWDEDFVGDEKYPNETWEEGDIANENPNETWDQHGVGGEKYPNDWEDENYPNETWDQHVVGDEKYPGESWEEGHIADEKYTNETWDQHVVGDEKYPNDSGHLKGDEKYHDENWDPTEKWGDGHIADEEYPNETWDEDFVGDEKYPNETWEEGGIANENPNETWDQHVVGGEKYPNDWEDQNYPNETWDQHVVGAEKYPGESWEEGRIADEKYPNETWDQHVVGDEKYPNDNGHFGDEKYPTEKWGDGHIADEEYPNETWDEDFVGDEKYPNETWDEDFGGDEKYPNETWDEDFGGDEKYPNDNWGEVAIADEKYPDESWDQHVVGDEKYPGESWDGSYCDDGEGKGFEENGEENTMACQPNSEDGLFVEEDYPEESWEEFSGYPEQTWEDDWEENYYQKESQQEEQHGFQDIFAIYGDAVSGEETEGDPMFDLGGSQPCRVSELPKEFFDFVGEEVSKNLHPDVVLVFDKYAPPIHIADKADQYFRKVSEEELDYLEKKAASSPFFGKFKAYMAMVLWLEGEFEPYAFCGTDRAAEICAFYLWCQCIAVMKGKLDLKNSSLLQDGMTEEMIRRQRTLELGECGSTSGEDGKEVEEKDSNKHSIRMYMGTLTVMMVGDVFLSSGKKQVNNFPY